MMRGKKKGKNATENRFIVFSPLPFRCSFLCAERHESTSSSTILPMVLLYTRRRVYLCVRCLAVVFHTNNPRFLMITRQVYFSPLCVFSFAVLDAHFYRTTSTNLRHYIRLPIFLTLSLVLCLYLTRTSCQSYVFSQTTCAFAPNA